MKGRRHIFFIKWNPIWARVDRQVIFHEKEGFFLKFFILFVEIVIK